MPTAIMNQLREKNAGALHADLTASPTYLFIAKTTAWPDEANPPAVLDTDSFRAQIYRDLVAMKRIGTENIAPIIPRVDWQAGAVYSQYDDTVDMLTSPTAWYVMTDEFNVYKCLYNAEGAISTVKPTGQNVTQITTADGYVWKYMYTVRAPDVFAFLTPDWMPVYTLANNDGSAQWNVQQAAVNGAIHAIKVVNQGTGYSAGSPPAVTITGDGTGATAVAVINGATGKISRINVTNIGANYTTATVTIAGNGTARVILSPIGGHGKSPRTELGAIHRMVRVPINGSESGTFPTNITFRQVGLISLPLGASTGTRLRIADARRFYVGQTITGATSGATGRVRVVDPDGITLWLDTVTGAFAQNESIGSAQTIVSTVSNTALPIIDTVIAAAGVVQRSGSILYVSNRERVTRNAAQNEDVRMIVTF